VNIFHRFPVFLRTFGCDFAEKVFCEQGSEDSRIRQLLKVLFLCYALLSFMIQTHKLYFEYFYLRKIILDFILVLLLNRWPALKALPDL
jgi:TRAP-type uncharacterized transport system fused permease subunit